MLILYPFPIFRSGKGRTHPNWIEIQIYLNQKPNCELPQKLILFGQRSSPGQISKFDVLTEYRQGEMAIVFHRKYSGSLL